MSDMNDTLLVLAIIAFGIFTVYRVIQFAIDGWKHNMKEDFAAKAEAMFQSQFPELQPHFHPRAIANYTLAHHQRQKLVAGAEWADPPGFAAAKFARITPTDKGLRTALVDAAGAVLGEFLYCSDDRPDVIATLRLGQGKFTVRQLPKARVAVKYWHPEREFTWKGEGLWSFKTPVADEPIFSHSDRISSTSSSSSSSSTSHAVGAAAFVGAGGAFDGGGASHGWDEGTQARSSRDEVSFSAASASETTSDGGSSASESDTTSDGESSASESSTAY